MTARPYGIYVHNLRVEATVPYKLEWLDEMKRGTKWNERHWDAASKTWWFPRELQPWIIQLCRRHFPNVPVVNYSVDAAHDEPFRAEYTEEESEYARKAAAERASQAEARQKQQQEVDQRNREEARRRGAQKAPPPPRNDWGGFGEDFESGGFHGGGPSGFKNFFDAFYRARQTYGSGKPPPSPFSGGQRRPPPPPPVRGGPATLEEAYVELLRELSPETLAKVYKVAIASAHPDAGGTHEKAVAINRAWDAIKKFRRIT